MFAIDLTPAAPGLDPYVSQRAAAAYTCAVQSGTPTKKLLVIDMSKRSSEPRLWVFDTSNPEEPTLMLVDRVAHGRGSDQRGKGWPQKFSNIVDSGMTSLGLYRVSERYVNNEGRPAFALDGLDAGFNDMARIRHVVLHPSGGVPRHGSVGRSLGCPSVNPKTFVRMSKANLEGALLWIDGPDASLAQAPSLSCAADVPVPENPSCRLRSEAPWASTSLNSLWSSRVSIRMTVSPSIRAAP